MRPDRALVIDVERAAELRRRAGPTAWVVLEALVARADGQSRVTTGVRELAQDLGLSKDTVARALVRLGRAAIVTRVDLRDEHTGRFIGVRYEIEVATTGMDLVATSGAAAGQRRGVARSSVSASGDQLSLLGAP